MSLQICREAVVFIVYPEEWYKIVSHEAKACSSVIQ